MGSFSGRAGGLSATGRSPLGRRPGLEDVELAFLAKRRRWAFGSVMPPMPRDTDVRTTAAMIEGWTKNLALLFNNALATALWKVLDILLLVGLPWLADHLWNARFSPHSLQWLGAGWVLVFLWVRNFFRFYAGWQSRIFRLWIVPFPRWDCRFLSRFSTEAGLSIGF